MVGCGRRAGGEGIVAGSSKREWSKRERLQAALVGEPADRVPIGFWGHFPTDPRRAEDLARETLAFQRQFDWDFVKLMPSGMYYPEALGCTLTPASGPGAVNGLADSIVKRPEDWERLPVPDPREGWLAEHVRSVQLVRESLGPDVPIIQTLFSPLTIIHKLCVHVRFEESIERHRPRVEQALRAIAEGSKQFVAATLDAGADGFFFATQEATRDSLDDATFLALGKKYDLDVLESTRGRATFNLLHVCRANIMADLVADYPVHAINWESHGAPPSLAEARGIWGQALVGGVDRYGVIVNGTPDDVREEVERAIEATGSRKLIVSAGCALSVARKAENLAAARRAVERVL
jgi:uroporphyrinogen decarboxylase